MIYVLDSDHISLVDRGTAEGERIRLHLRTVPPDDIAVTVVSYEEQIRGWMSVLAQAQTVTRQIPYYSELQKLLRFYCKTPMLDFDEKAAVEFERLRQAKIRIGTMDLKIAAIALVNNATVLTRNLRDFGKVPSLKAEDWSI